MPNERIMLAGGGDEKDSRALDEIFAGWTGNGRLLYLPTALVHPSNIQAGVRWIQQAFAPLGIKNIEAWPNLIGKTASDLNAFDAIYIGGGNTFYLLQQLRHHKLALALEDFAGEGKPIYGGSAGAIVLGYDITPCAHIDENIIGLTDFSGLDLALGYSIWCHYAPNDERRIQKYVAKTGIPSIALSERAGAYRKGDHLYAAGYEPVIRFTLGVQVVCEPGSIIE
jgi:dipeptidase E